MPDTTQNGIEYKGEIWGRIWESIAWSKEEAEAQRLSNIIFMAAKEDIILDKEAARNEKYTSSPYLDIEHIKTNEEVTYNETTKTETKKITVHNKYSTKGSTASLDKIIATLETEAKKREELKEKLLPSYVDIKHYLSSVRVLGVGNSTVEKIGAACKIACKAICTVIGPLVAAIGISALTVVTPGGAGALAASFAVGTGIPSTLLAAGVTGFASLSLANERKNIKGHLKKEGFVQKELERRSKYDINPISKN